METDINQLSTHDILALAPSLLGDEDTVISCLQRIFEMLLMRSLQPRAVAHILCTNITPSLSTTKMLLDFLDCLTGDENKELRSTMIECIPNIVGSTPEEIDLVVDYYKRIIGTDRNLLVPVIGSLSELNLPERLKPEIFCMSTDALKYLEETDFPVVVRTLMKTIQKDNADKLVDIVRYECRNLEPHTITLILEVISNSLIVNIIAERSFLGSLEHEASLFSSLDVSILLVLLSSPRARKKSLQVMFRSILSGLLPPSLLFQVLKLTDIWGNYHHSIVFLCRSLVSFAASQVTHGKFEVCAIYQWIHEIFSISFGYYISIQDQILNLLAEFICGQTGSSVNQDKQYGTSLQILSSRILLYLTKDHLPHLALLSNILEEIIYHSSSLTIIVQHDVGRALSRIALLKQNLLNNIMIYIQKNLFSTFAETQTSALILLTHLLHTHKEHERGLPETEKRTLIGWLDTFFQSFHSNRVLVIDIFAFIANDLPQELASKIFCDILEPLCQRLDFSANTYSSYGSHNDKLIQYTLKSITCERPLENLCFTFAILRAFFAFHFIHQTNPVTFVLDCIRSVDMSSVTRKPVSSIEEFILFGSSIHLLNDVLSQAVSSLAQTQDAYQQFRAACFDRFSFIHKLNGDVQELPVQLQSFGFRFCSEPVCKLISFLPMPPSRSHYPQLQTCLKLLYRFLLEALNMNLGESTSNCDMKSFSSCSDATLESGYTPIDGILELNASTSQLLDTIRNTKVLCQIVILTYFLLANMQTENENDLSDRKTDCKMLSYCYHIIGMGLQLSCYSMHQINPLLRSIASYLQKLNPANASQQTDAAIVHEFLHSQLSKLDDGCLVTVLLDALHWLWMCDATTRKDSISGHSSVVSSAF